VLSCLLARRLAALSEFTPNLSLKASCLAMSCDGFWLQNKSLASWKKRRPEKKTTGAMESSATPIENFWEKMLL
jgi:hypothetical protein